jgi:hypothetical protein
MQLNKEVDTYENIDVNTNINTDEIVMKDEECIELKNIKYKTMLINGVSISETKSSQSLQNLDKFLQNEKNTNENEPWCKLNKTIKIKKFMDYIENYKIEQKLSDEETNKLTIFLKDCLNRKKLQRIKDVIYDKEKGIISDIPALTYNKVNKNFTLKNIEKRVSTLKSLPQKKTHTHGTVKNKNNNDDDDDDDCNSSDNE